ncbi:MAG: hypothetical protein EB023_12835, partial [Flavobacteriia bacterium]|nr:hypothetical protein [Flavobacteriia bacterium]
FNINPVGFGKYIYLLDGLLFCFFAAFSFHHIGLTGFIWGTLLMDLLLPGLYGLWRSGRFFETPVWVVLKSSLQNCGALFTIILFSVFLVSLFFTFIPVTWFVFLSGGLFYFLMVGSLAWAFGSFAKFYQFLFGSPSPLPLKGS